MKKFLTLLIMTMIVSMASYADGFTKPSSKVTQNMVTAEVRDVRGTGGSNQAPYIEFTNNSGQTVQVEMIVYYDGKEVDNKTLRFAHKTYKELFSSVAAINDKAKNKNFTVSIRVTFPSGGYDDNM